MSTPYEKAPQQQVPHQHATHHPYQASPGPVPAPPTLAVPSAAATPPARRRVLGPVAVTAVVAVALASAGTAALTGAFDDAPEPASTTASSVFGGLGQPSESSVNVPVASSSETNPDWEAVSVAVAPSVVAIAVTTTSGAGVGSGVIIDGEGHIVTNDHVVAGAADGTVEVTLDDGRIYQAEITGLDPETDLAVVKIVDPPDDLGSAVFADSDDVVVGEPVMAMGNPLGLSNTATTGIVSAIDRPVSTTATGTDTQVVTNALQIDAAVNPGNSGGPLFNASGEVIGITSSIATFSSGSGQGGSIGLGFAIPSNLAQNIGAQLMKNGVAEHAFLGVSLSDGTGTADETTRQGAVVQEVSDDSPAAAAQLEQGDVIVAIDSDPVTGAQSLTGFVRALPSGATVTLTLVRDGEALDVEVTLATKPVDAAQGAPAPGGSAPDGTTPGGSPDSPSAIPDLRNLFPGEG